ncbi:protein MEI2-like 6 [Miscanthus floridulus]|uniref:protein MEI2-like 6 n=1 Tax=Miscanthus floridulus TaxID=154761 RepID=UPI00345A9DAA
MAPSISSLSPTAPAYIPQRGAPWIPPPPVPGFTAYICMAPPPPPEFLPWPPLAPPPPPPCWSVPQAPCVPGMQEPFHGCVVPVPHGAMAMAMTPSGPAPGAWPRRHPKAKRMQRVAGPAPAANAASCGVKAAGDAKEAATNQPSPRSVLAVAAPSPPISPTTSLPTSFPYQLVLPAPPTAKAGFDSAAAPPPAEGSVAVRPPQRRGRLLRGPRRARPASRVLVRRTVKPRRLFDPSSERTSLMIRNIPNDFTRTRLMNILDEHCFIENEKIAPGGVRSEYDFLYLPIDFRSLANKGYAFVNMTSPEAAWRLFEHLHGHWWGFKHSGKTCAVDYAYREGLDELVEHFSGSRFDCHTEAYLPVRFEPPRDGTRPAEGAMHVVGRLAARLRAGDGK